MNQTNTPHFKNFSDTWHHEVFETLNISSWDDFISLSHTHYHRLLLSERLHKPLLTINRLAIYFDFLRLTSISPELSEIFVELKIPGVMWLRKIDAEKLLHRIIKKYPYLDQSLRYNDIKNIVSESKQAKIIFFDIQSDDLKLKKKWYAKTRMMEYQELSYIKNESKYEVVSLILQIIIFIGLSFVSVYFIVFVIVLLWFHLLKNSYFISDISYKTREKIEQNTQWSQHKNEYFFWVQQNFLMVKRWVIMFAIFVCVWIFIYGLFYWNVIYSISNTFDNSKNITQFNSWPKYLPVDIYSRFENNTITREELIWILYFSQKDTTFTIKNCFNDISESIYAEQICDAKRRWIIQWDANNDFNPKGVVSHAAGLKFILNFSGENVPKRAAYLTFTDLEKRFWYTSYAEYAKSHGIIDSSMKEFDPLTPITISQIDSYLYKLTLRMQDSK